MYAMKGISKIVRVLGRDAASGCRYFHAMTDKHQITSQRNLMASIDVYPISV